MEENKTKEDVVEQEKDNVLDMDDYRVRKLKVKGHTPAMLERFEVLRLKLIYDKLDDPKEARELVLLVKYFMDNGPTEAFRTSCRYMYEKYVKPFKL